VSKKFDGWCVKSYWGETPLLVPYFFRERRTDVIKAWESGIKGLWRRQKRRGMVECVKVKLIEVE